jgi:hypothetical protein
MDEFEFDSRPLNGEDPVESVRRLLAEAERVSHDLGALADEAVARSEAGRRDARRLIEALAAATATLAGESGVEDEEAEPDEPEPAPAAPGSDGARLLARQMLAGGADREAVEESLRTSFGIADADAIVDSVLTGA